MPAEPSVEELRQRFTDWTNEQGRATRLERRGGEGLCFGEPAWHERRWIVEILEEGEDEWTTVIIAKDCDKVV